MQQQRYFIPATDLTPEVINHLHNYSTFFVGECPSCHKHEELITSSNKHIALCDSCWGFYCAECGTFHNPELYGDYSLCEKCFEKCN